MQKGKSKLYLPSPRLDPQENLNEIDLCLHFISPLSSSSIFSLSSQTSFTHQGTKLRQSPCLTSNSFYSQRKLLHNLSLSKAKTHGEGLSVPHWGFMLPSRAIPVNHDSHREGCHDWLGLGRYPHRVTTWQIFSFFFLIFKHLIYWNIVDLQCCVHFRYTAK